MVVLKGLRKVSHGDGKTREGLGWLGMSGCGAAYVLFIECCKESSYDPKLVFFTSTSWSSWSSQVTAKPHWNATWQHDLAIISVHSNQIQRLLFTFKFYRFLRSETCQSSNHPGGEPKKPSQALRFPGRQGAPKVAVEEQGRVMRWGGSLKRPKRRLVGIFGGWKAIHYPADFFLCSLCFSGFGQGCSLGCRLGFWCMCWLDHVTFEVWV